MYVVTNEAGNTYHDTANDAAHYARQHGGRAHRLPIGLAPMVVPCRAKQDLPPAWCPDKDAPSDG